MKTSKLLLFLTIIFLLISCREPEPLSPYEFYQSEQSLNKSDNMISVMTRNLYVGTDVDMILEEENPELIPVRVAEAFNLLQETNFPERALALAKEIIEKQFLPCNVYRKP